MEQVNRTKRTWMNIPALKMKEGEIDGDGKDVGEDRPFGKSIKT